VGMQTGPSHSWAMDVTELPFSPSFYQPEWPFPSLSIAPYWPRLWRWRFAFIRTLRVAFIDAWPSPQCPSSLCCSPAF
jgi:hypothetical protein